MPIPLWIAGGVVAAAAYWISEELKSSSQSSGADDLGADYKTKKRAARETELESYVKRLSSNLAEKYEIIDHKALKDLLTERDLFHGFLGAKRVASPSTVLTSRLPFGMQQLVSQNDKSLMLFRTGSAFMAMEEDQDRVSKELKQYNDAMTLLEDIESEFKQAG